MFYTGIGSRKTPRGIKEIMERTAMELESKGYILRTGDAYGADKAFAKGVIDDENKRIYTVEDTTPEAMNIGEELHPAWYNLTKYQKKLIARNSFQLLGDNLDTASDFVICWTPDGARSDAERTQATGGTGQVISIATVYCIPSVPVFNLKNIDDKNKVLDLINNNITMDIFLS